MPIMGGLFFRLTEKCNYTQYYTYSVLNNCIARWCLWLNTGRCIIVHMGILKLTGYIATY